MCEAVSNVMACPVTASKLNMHIWPLVNVFTLGGALLRPTTGVRAEMRYDQVSGAIYGLTRVIHQTHSHTISGVAEIKNEANCNWQTVAHRARSFDVFVPLASQCSPRWWW